MVLDASGLDAEDMQRIAAWTNLSETTKDLAQLADKLHDWQIIPTGAPGYSKAEATCGGVDTYALSSKIMHANDVPDLFFTGEAIDVTGHLGDYNFQ